MCLGCMIFASSKYLGGPKPQYLSKGILHCYLSSTTNNTTSIHLFSLYCSFFYMIPVQHRPRWPLPVLLPSFCACPKQDEVIR